MGLVRIMSWYPNFNGSHFGLPLQLDPQNDWLGGKMVWNMMCIRTGPINKPKATHAESSCTLFLKACSQDLCCTDDWGTKCRTSDCMQSVKSIQKCAPTSINMAKRNNSLSLDYQVVTISDSLYAETHQCFLAKSILELKTREKQENCQDFKSTSQEVHKWWGGRCQAT